MDSGGGNPSLHQRLEPTSVLCLAFQSDTLPTEPSLPLTSHEEEQKNKKKKNKNQMSKNKKTKKKKNSNKKAKPGKTKGWETKTSLLTQCSRFL